MQLERDLRYFIKRLESAILVNPKEQDKRIRCFFQHSVDIENDFGSISKFSNCW